MIVSALAIKFQSTPPARGATPLKGDFIHLIKVSIHAPRTGGDVVLVVV